MAIRLRLYIFEEGGAIKRVPRRIHDSLAFGEEAIPAYAGTRQRVTQIIVETEDGKPARILDAIGCYWDFDQEGRIDAGLERSLWSLMELGNDGRGHPNPKVIDLRPELKRKKFEDQHRWDISAEDLNRIAADLWPSLADAPAIKTVQGKRRKKPPLTHEARRSLREIQSKISSIGMELQDLSEPALKGLIYEAERLAKGYRDERIIWTAIAQEADKQREIKARHRTGKGIFYALLHVWHEDSPRHSREIDTVEERCDGKKAAIEAARRLLAENAHRFSEDVTIDAEVISELEWQPSPEADPEDDGDLEETTSA